MPEQQTIPVRIQLTADDYAEFNRYHGRRQMALLFFLYWIVFVAVAGMRGGAADAGRFGLLIPAGLVLSGLLIAMHLWSIKVKTRKLFQNDKLAQMEQQLHFSETGIRHTTAESSNLVEWADVYRAAETRNELILYLARNRAILVPKRDIGAQWQQVKELLRTHLPPRKLGLKS
ncbi:YcxB family protein [Cohnella pontilimi]|nr:YcxB family protein [Cohnella pontilimi]